MTEPIIEVAANPQLQVSPTTTLYSGMVRLGQQDAFTLSRAGQAPTEYGFFVPDAPPWTDAAEPPRAWAEAHLMLLRMVDTRFDMGVERAMAGYLADPRGGYGSLAALHCAGARPVPPPGRLPHYRHYHELTAPARC